MANKKYRVLCDLAPTLFGYSGIPQDARTMFLSLSQVKNIELTGLISGIGSDVALCKLGSSGDALKEVENLAYFLLALKRKKNIYDRYKLLKPIEYLFKLICYFKKNYQLYPYRKELVDFLWRECFDGAVSGAYRETVQVQHFVASNFTKFFLKARLLSGLSSPVLNTQGYDFTIFQDPMLMSPVISLGTQPIVRCHDLVPLTWADTLANPVKGPKMYAKGILSSRQNGAVFVCDSPNTKDELLSIVPDLEKRTFVIPVCVIQNIEEQPKLDKYLCDTIVRERLSHLQKDQIQVDVDSYIISVSTIEPRKNFLGLIRAWEKVRYEYDSSLKLVLVGSLGWEYEDVLEAMKPHLETGCLLHLEKVPAWELKVLYANAKAFVFPTYYEGFGITPVEAQLAGCPCIVSDIPTLRWVMGEGALYADPYRIESFSDSIERLLYSNEAIDLSDQLKQKAYMNAQRFSLSSVALEWENLFEKLGDR